MRVTRATIAIVLALLLPAAVGCGGSSGGSSSSPAAAADNGESAKAPAQILSDVNDAVRGAQSVHMSGSVNSDSTDIGFDVKLSADAAKGTLTLSGNEIKLVRVGDAAYFIGSPEFYKMVGGGDAAVSLLQGRWIKVPSADSRFASFEQFTDKGKLFSSMLQAEGTVTKSGTRRYNGQKVIVLRDSDGGGDLYIAASGKPYPVAIVSTGDKQGTITFTGWDEPVDVSAPADAIDLSQL
jgi:hypothetical protein